MRIAFIFPISDPHSRNKPLRYPISINLGISYELNEDEEGNQYKLITTAEEFGSYEEAEAFLLSQESGNYEIVGVDPFISPVPLEALEDYQLIHSSDGSIEVPNVGEIPAVKIFEYLE